MRWYGDGRGCFGCVGGGSLALRGGGNGGGVVGRVAWQRGRRERTIPGRRQARMETTNT